MPGSALLILGVEYVHIWNAAVTQITGSKDASMEKKVYNNKGCNRTALPFDTLKPRKFHDM